MNESDINRIFKLVRDKGFQVAPGLTSEELDDIEKQANVVFPEDFRQLLQAGVPLGSEKPRKGVIGGGTFPDYRTNAVAEINQFREFVKDAFRLDIENDEDFWMDEFGHKPSNTEDAVSQAFAVLDSLPTLLPIFSHRCMPSEPSISGNPVFSFWQPTDTIIYGENLQEYFEIEFGEGNQQDIWLSKVRQVPFWTRLLNL